MRFLSVAFLVASAAVTYAAAPPTPTGLATTTVTARSVGLTWSVSTGATSYYVFRNGSQIGTATTTTFSDTTVSAGTTYSYTVSAINTGDNPVTASPQSSALSVTTGTLPAVPTGLRASSASTTVTLNWNAVSGATEYVVFRNGTEYETVTATTFTDDDVDPATTYRYSVASSNAAGESSQSTAVSITTRGDGSRREKVWTQAFQAVDGNFDGIVTFEEYLRGHPLNRLPEVVMYHRFMSSDDDGSLDLDVWEYIDHFGGKTVKRPSKVQTFYLADTMADDEESGDDLLSIDEFARTLTRGTKESVIIKRFNKLDKDGTGLLSQREFGIRNGTSEAQ